MIMKAKTAEDLAADLFAEILVKTAVKAAVGCIIGSVDRLLPAATHPRGFKVQWAVMTGKEFPKCGILVWVVPTAAME